MACLSFPLNSRRDLLLDLLRNPVLKLKMSHPYLPKPLMTAEVARLKQDYTLY